MWMDEFYYVLLFWLGIEMNSLYKSYEWIGFAGFVGRF